MWYLVVARLETTAASLRLHTASQLPPNYLWRHPLGSASVVVVVVVHCCTRVRIISDAFTAIAPISQTHYSDLLVAEHNAVRLGAVCVG